MGPVVVYQITPKFFRLKQQIFIISLFLWTRNLETVYLGAPASRLLTKVLDYSLVHGFGRKKTSFQAYSHLWEELSAS